MTTLKAEIKARIEAETRVKFGQRAKSLGLSESGLLRRLALQEIAQAGSDAELIEADPGDAETVRITVRMPAFLLRDVKSAATRKGMAPSRWISALIQSNLMRNPVMNKAEISALQASARELVAIGRNINQIAYALNLAKSINAAAFEASWVPLQKLEALSDGIRQNREAIRELVRASQGAWAPDQ